MVSFRPLAALTPPPHLAPEVAAPPYDVVNRAEASAFIEGKPNSLMRVTRVDALLPEGASLTSPEAYNQAALELEGLIERGALERAPAQYYAYAQHMQTAEGLHSQMGLVGLASAADYRAGKVKRHEFTLPRKEEDRMRLIERLRAHLGPVFLTYRAQPTINALISEVTSGEPSVDFVAEDGVRHQLWPVSEGTHEEGLLSAFAELDALYIADGHHRAAAAARVGEGAGDDDPRAHFLAVAFPHDQLYLMPYNRVVKHLNGHSPEGLRAALSERFELSALTPAELSAEGLPQASPTHRHEWLMCLEGAWWRLAPNAALTQEISARDVKAQLAVSVLQDEVLSPLLGVDDPRTCEHIDFVGGIRGLSALAQGASAGGVAFALSPTSTREVMEIADAGEVMPPKSTWFEPKLRSGLLVSTF